MGSTVDDFSDDSESSESFSDSDDDDQDFGQEEDRQGGIEQWLRSTKDLVAPMDVAITEQSLIGLKQHMSEQHAWFLLHMIDKEAKRRSLIQEHPPYLGCFAHVYDNILELTGIFPVGDVYLDVNQHAWRGHLNNMYDKYCSE
jgi:hypothetical protein